MNRSAEMEVFTRVVDLGGFSAAATALRLTPSAVSKLVSRKLGESRMVVVASKAYLRAHGTPKRPSDLERHNCLAFCFDRTARVWPFRVRTRGRKPIAIAPSGNALVADGEAMRGLALAGLGIARLAAFHVGGDIDEGRLVPILEEQNPGDVQPIHAVVLGPSPKLPARVRAFLDYLREHVHVREAAVAIR